MTDYPRFISTDEDGERGCMEHREGETLTPDQALGLFIVLARSEWDILYDPAGVTVHEPRDFVPYRSGWRADEGHLRVARKGEKPQWTLWTFENLDGEFARRPVASSREAQGD